VKGEGREEETEKSIEFQGKEKSKHKKGNGKEPKQKPPHGKKKTPRQSESPEKKNRKKNNPSQKKTPKEKLVVSASGCEG